VNDYTKDSTWEVPTIPAQSPASERGVGGGLQNHKGAVVTGAAVLGLAVAGLVEHERHKHENQSQAGGFSQISAVSTQKVSGSGLPIVGEGNSWGGVVPQYIYKPSLISVVSWGPGRLDAFVVGTDRALYHRAHSGGGWIPSTYERLGGHCTCPPVVSTGGLNNLDIYVLGGEDKLWRKWWLNAWAPAMTDYQCMSDVPLLKGSPPSIITRGLNRTDVFSLGTDRQLLHKWWDGNMWNPSLTAWQPLGGSFASPPAVVSSLPTSLVLIGLGTDGQMHHKAFWGNAWHPSISGWDAFGGPFISAPNITSWGPDRFDIFATGADHRMHHRWWSNGTWSQSWEVHGGTLGSMPVAVSWGRHRLDVFARGVDGALLHKAWEGNRWVPSQHEWESHGGSFHGAPAAVCWGPNRIDVLAVAEADGDPQHKAWSGASWTPWETLGGKALFLE
jgi:hypothetical protein